MFDRVHAIGSDTYIRVYPNPGVGLCLGRRRIALSVYGGLEWFRAKDTNHGRIWIRSKSFLSRVKRPGSR